MNIVTIMMYDWSNVNTSSMCLAWVRQAKQWLKSEDTVIILTKRRVSKSLTNNYLIIWSSGTLSSTPFKS